MDNNRLREHFNDGFIEYGTKTTQRSEKGKRIGEVFIPQGKLAYTELSFRDEDYKMAQSMSAVLNIKIRTLCPPSLRNTNKNKLTVLKDGIEFDVIKADSDLEKRYLYFYLQEVGLHGQN